MTADDPSDTNARPQVVQHIGTATGPVVGSVDGNASVTFTQVDAKPPQNRVLRRVTVGVGVIGVLVTLGFLGQSLAIWIVVATGMLGTAGYVVVTCMPRRRGWELKVDVRESATLALLAQNVRRLWIDQALHHSLRDAVRLQIELDSQADAVAATGWSDSQLEVLRTPVPLADGTTVGGLRDAGATQILIIGDPGSGKTTHLLEFAEYLLARAADDEHQPVPVVVLLSFWSGEHERFDEWLISELIQRYRVLPEQAEVWLRSGRLAVLLDGLDEVAADARITCRNSIDAFARDPRFASTVMAVTCRTTEYTELNRLLPFDTAVRVRPLSFDQVCRSLQDAGADYAALLHTLEEDNRLAELVTTPLMFGVLVLATRGLLPDVRIESDRIYDLFTARMLVRARALRDGVRARPEFSPNRVFFHLVWLARLMANRNRTIFYPDLLTPAWLPDRQWADDALPPVDGLTGWVASKLGWDHASTGLVGAGYAALIAAVAAAPLAALAGGFVVMAIIVACASLGCALLVGFVFGVLFQTDAGERSLALILYREEQTAFSATHWNWSWRHFLRGCLALLVPAIIVFAIGATLVGPQQAVAVSAILFLAGGLSGASVPDHTRPPASLGTALAASTRRFVRLLGVLLAVVLVVAGVLSATGGPASAVVAALPLAAACMLVAGPGRAWLRRRAAFFGARRSQILPRDLSSFLSTAENRVLMRRAGGGYMFLHGTYQDYLTRCDPDRPPLDHAASAEI